MKLYTIVRAVSCILLFGIFLLQQAFAATCEQTVRELNAGLAPKIDARELVEVLQSLNSTNNRTLPPRFVTKQQAMSQGWKPGQDLWSIPALKGSSMGGDRFRNREGRLPDRKWREADLDYKGGHRGGERLVFSNTGDRFVTVDHYRTFIEVPQCR